MIQTFKTFIYENANGDYDVANESDVSSILEFINFLYENGDIDEDIIDEFLSPGAKHLLKQATTGEGKKLMKQQKGVKKSVSKSKSSAAEKEYAYDRSIKAKRSIFHQGKHTGKSMY